MKILVIVIPCITIIACSSSIETKKIYKTYTVQPGAEEGKDAEIWNLAPYTSYSNYSGYCDTTNFGNKPYFRAASWTYFGEKAIHRSYIQFNIQAIPSKSIIDSAFLYLYSDTSTGQFQSGENDLYIKPVLEFWNESKLTWYNQPEVLDDTSKYKFVYVPKSKSESQDYKIEITSLLKYWIEDQNKNYGMQISLADENLYSRAFFASSDNSKVVLRPKLEVYYNYEK